MTDKTLPMIVTIEPPPPLPLPLWLHVVPTFWLAAYAPVSK